MKNNIDEIVKTELFKQEKQLMILLTGSPETLKNNVLYKFPITHEETPEGSVYQQNVIMVPENYVVEGTFEEEDKKFASACLKTLIRR